MAKLKIEEITDKKIWESFILSQSKANFLQSWAWGQFHRSLNKSIFRRGFYKNGKLVGVMLCIIEDAKRGKYLTVPAGPIIAWEDKSIVEAYVDEVKRIAKEKKCVFVRVRPQLEADEFSKKLFEKFGFINASAHLHAELTNQLDITKSEEDLMSNMRKATRYEIRKAISQKINVSSSQDPKLIRKFYNLQVLTSKRQKFVPFSYKFLYEQFKIFSDEGNALLYSAKIGNKLLAQAFIIFYGKEAVYHYGASTPEGRKYPGAYLIQWEAIKEARRRGMKKYNLWGVSPPNQKNHRFWGISIFKRGFGGQDLEYLHAQDLIIDGFRYKLNFIVEIFRKKLRHV